MAPSSIRPARRSRRCPLPRRSTRRPPEGPGGEAATPVTTRETLTYSTRLEDPTPAEETLRPNDVAPKPATAKPLAKETPAAGTEPPGGGWVVQVQAVTSRTEADALARRLTAKGYRTFVTPRGSGYGVRVGKFDKKSDAEATRARLEKEEQFKPWVTR